MKLRSSGKPTSPSVMDINKNITQTRALRQLALNCEQRTTSRRMLESVTQYIRIVSIGNVLPPAAIIVPNTYKQAMDSP